MLVSGRPIAILTSNEREGVRGDFNLCFRVVEAVEKGVHALQPVTPPGPAAAGRAPLPVALQLCPAAQERTRPSQPSEQAARRPRHLPLLSLPRCWQLEMRVPPLFAQRVPCLARSAHPRTCSQLSRLLLAGVLSTSFAVAVQSTGCPIWRVFQNLAHLQTRRGYHDW